MIRSYFKNHVYYTTIVLVFLTIQSCTNYGSSNYVAIEGKKVSHFCEASSLLVAGTGIEPVTFK